MKNWKFRGALLVLASSGALAGCGSSSASTPVAAPASAVTPVQTQVSAPAQPPYINDNSLTYKTVADLKTSDGYTATITLYRGELRRAKPMIYGERDLGATCGVNRQTDAALPFKLVLQNTTKNYKDIPTAELTITYPPDTDGVIAEAEVDYTTGPQCVTLGAADTDVLDVTPTNEMGPIPDEVVGFIIAKNYYSPAHPNGNVKVWNQVDLTFGPDPSSVDDWSVVGGKGLMSSQTINNVIPFIPGANGGCLIHIPCPTYTIPGG